MRRALTLITKRDMAATKTHYDRVAASYHDAYFYSDAYEMWQRDEVLQRLQLQPHHIVFSTLETVSLLSYFNSSR